MYIRVFALFLFLIVAALPVPAFADDCITATNSVNLTTSTRTIYHTTDIAVSRQVDTFAVHLVGRMQGGPVLYDQTFNAAYADPAVQAAVEAAKGALTGGGAVSISGPALLSSNTALVSSVPLTGPPVVTATNVSVATTEYIGPQTIMTGENQGTCLILLTGQIDFDALVTTDVYQTITTTTTDTFLYSALYELVGLASAAPSFTSAAGAGFTIGAPGSFTVAAGGTPAPSLSETGALPGGVTFIDNGNGTATLSGTPAAASSGVYHLTFTARNSAGPDATQGFTLTILEPAPLAVNLSTLSDGATTIGSNRNAVGNATSPWPWPALCGLYSGIILNVSGTATSPDGIQSVTCNGATVALSADNSFSIPLLLSSGPNTITVVAIDNAGHQATSARTITLASTGPALTVISPADGAGTRQTSITVTGTTSADTTVVARVNDGAAQPATMNGTDFTVTVNLTAGLNTIELTATDSSTAGNSAKLTVNCDPAAPDLAITSPARDLITGSGAVTLTGSVSSSALPVSVSIGFDGQTFTPPVTNGVFRQQLNLTAEKAYAIVVTAMDAIAHTSVARRNTIYSMTATGDMNGDCKVDIVDALQALKSCVRIITPTADEVRRGNVAPVVQGVPEPDGIIKITDALLILRKAVGLGW